MSVPSPVQLLAHDGRTRWLFDLLAASVLLLLGAFALVRLRTIPILDDEGTALRWIWRILEAGEWSSPLLEGQPLEAWPLVPLLRLGVSPLFAVRAAHVLAGTIACLLLYVLTRRLTDRPTAFASGVLFALCPFALYVQRFALPQMLLCAAEIATLLATLSYLRERRWWQAASLAAVLCVTALCDIPVGFAALAVLPLALLSMPAAERAGLLLSRPALLQVATSQAPAALLLLTVAVIVAFRLLLGQEAGFGWHPDAPGSWHDVETFMGVSPLNLFAELATQLSWPVLVLAAGGILAALMLNDWVQRWLVVIGASNLLFGSLLGAGHPRNLLPALPPLIVAGATGFRACAIRFGQIGKVAAWGAWLVCVGCLGHQSLRLVLNPTLADWSPIDRFNYFEGWGSGYGYPEAAAFILNAPEPPAQVLSLDGHSAYQLRCYLPAPWYPRVHAIDFGPDGGRQRSPHARLENLLQPQPSWLLVAEQLLPRYLEASLGSDYETQLSLRRLASFSKPGARVQLTLYEARAK